MNWYIGQPIVAIRSHSQGAFRKGQEFVIKGLRMAPCGCGNTQIDVGIRSSNRLAHCGACKRDYNRRSDCWYMSQRMFAPLDQDISELTEMLTKKQGV